MTVKYIKLFWYQIVRPLKPEIARFFLSDFASNPHFSLTLNWIDLYPFGI